MNLNQNNVAAHVVVHVLQTSSVLLIMTSNQGTSHYVISLQIHYLVSAVLDILTCILVILILEESSKVDIINDLS